MDEATRSLIGLSAALGAGDRARLEAAVERASAVADPVAVEEVLLQSYLFVGFPVALNAFALWRERSGRSAPAPTPDDPVSWAQRGDRVCAQVYTDQYARLRANVARLHPDMERWMLAEGYGKVLGRPGLELRVRELCIAALLVGLDAEPQLYAHLRGALNVGASLTEVDEAVRIAVEQVPAARAESALAIWAEVRQRWDRKRSLESTAGDHVR